MAVLQNLKTLSKKDKKKLVALAKPFAGTIVENYKRVMNQSREHKKLPRLLISMAAFPTDNCCRDKEVSNI